MISPCDFIFSSISSTLMLVSRIPPGLQIVSSPSNQLFHAYVTPMVSVTCPFPFLRKELSLDETLTLTLTLTLGWFYSTATAATLIANAAGTAVDRITQNPEYYCFFVV